MKKIKTILIQALISAIPLLYLYSKWSHLPEMIPIHYNIQFQADKLGSKFDLLGLVIFMFTLNLAISLLLLNLNSLDPKKRYSANHPLLVKITWALTIFMALLSSYFIYGALQYNQMDPDGFSPKYLIALVALLFVVLGNFMNTIKPNYFIGIRTPWTLDDEENWRRTHQLASKIWFFGGLLMFILVLLIPKDYTAYISAIFIIPLAGIPVFYSFYIFRQKQNQS